MNAAFSENKLLATTDGALKLYFNGSQKLATTSGGVTVTGGMTADSLSIDSLSMNGTSIGSSGNMTLDVAGDITLDADGGDVRLKDNGTEFLNFYAGTIERTGSLVFDVSGNITLNADGSTISLSDGSLNFGQFYQNASGALNINVPAHSN